MALLYQLHILIIFLTQNWEAPDLSVVYAFVLLTHEKNMFVKHPKIKQIQDSAHTRPRLGAATLGSVNEANLTVLCTSFNFMVAHKAILTQPPCVTRFLCLRR